MEGRNPAAGRQGMVRRDRMEVGDVPAEPDRWQKVKESAVGHSTWQAETLRRRNGVIADRWHRYGLGQGKKRYEGCRRSTHLGEKWCRWHGMLGREGEASPSHLHSFPGMPATEQVCMPAWAHGMVNERGRRAQRIIHVYIPYGAGKGKREKDRKVMGAGRRKGRKSIEVAELHRHTRHGRQEGNMGVCIQTTA